MKSTSALTGLAFSALLVTACGSVDPQEQVRRGSEFLKQKKYQEAIVELRAAVQANPELAEARVKLAEAYTETGNLPNALRETVRAADLMPNDAAAQIRAGSLLLAAGSFEDADSRANRALKIDPKNAEALVLKGSALTGLRKFDDALAKYEEAIAGGSAGEQGYLGVGSVQLNRGDRNAAEATFKRALTMNPKSLDARLALADLYWRAGEFDAVERELKMAREANPNLATLNRALGILALTRGKTADAEPYLVAYAETDHTAGAKFTLANYYLSTKRSADARRVLQAAESSDGGAEATVRLAGIDLLEGKTADARKRVDGVLEKSPKQLNALTLKAQLLTNDRKYEEALAVIATAISVDSNAPGVRMLAGSVYSEMNRREDAIASYEAALKSAARSPSQTLEANLKLGALQLLSGSVDKARTYAQSALQLQPASADAHFLAARIDAATGDLRQARLRLTALDKSFPDSASVDVLRGQIELASKRPDLAAAAFRSALDRHPADIEALSGLTQLDLNAGKSREAVARIENALQKGNASASLQMLAAKTYTVTKDLAKAETSLHAAIGQDPNRFDAYSMLGQIYAVQKRIPEGVKQFETILGRNPKSVGASTAIGVLWQVQGRKADAETAYERTLTIDPRASVASNNLAWLLVESDRNLDRALELAQTARQQHPEDVDVADTLGWIFVKKKLAMSAIPLLESSAKAKPNDPVIQYHLGMAYKLSGNKLDARRALGRALELNQAFTGSDEARQALAAL